MHTNFLINCKSLLGDQVPEFSVRKFQRDYMCNAIQEFSQSDESYEPSISQKSTKRMIVKEKCICLKTAKQECHQGLFACGTQDGQIFIGHAYDEPTQREEDIQFYNIRYYESTSLLEKEKQNLRILMPRVESEKIHRCTVYDLQWMSQDRQIITVGADQICQIMDLEQQVILDSVGHHTASIKCVTHSEDESIIATGGRDGKVYFYDTRQGLQNPTHSFTFTQMKFGSQSPVLNGKKPVGGSLQVPAVTGLAFSRNYLLNVVESLTEKITLLDVRKLSTTKCKKGLSDKIVSGQVENNYFCKLFNDPCTSTKGSSWIVVKDFKMLVSSTDHMNNYYDMTNLLGEPPLRFTGHKASTDFSVRSNFGFGQSMIISGSEDSFVYIWDIKRGTLLGRLGSTSHSFGHTGVVNEAHTIGSDLIISGSDDMSVIVWELIKSS